MTCSLRLWECPRYPRAKSAKQTCGEKVLPQATEGLSVINSAATRPRYRSCFRTWNIASPNASTIARKTPIRERVSASELCAGSSQLATHNAFSPRTGRFVTTFPAPSSYARKTLSCCHAETVRGLEHDKGSADRILIVCEGLPKPPGATLSHVADPNPLSAD